MQAFVLESWAALRVTGADAESFLQGQLSADLRALGPDRAAWASYNSPKGRMLGVMLMVRDADAIELWLPCDLVEPLSRRLRMFVLRSKVAIEAPGARHGLAVIGAGAAAWLETQGLGAPAEALAVWHGAGRTVVRAAGASPRFLLIGGEPSLATGEPDEAAWRRADIEAGIPVVRAATQDRWVAQMANLDRIGGISFDKGCYTGQEVVARLHYLGNLKKRMFRVRGSGPAPAPGTAIRDTAGDGQAVGDIVDACDRPEGGFVASAVLQLSAADRASLVLERETDAALAQPEAFLYPAETGATTP